MFSRLKFVLKLFPKRIHQIYILQESITTILDYFDFFSKIATYWYFSQKIRKNIVFLMPILFVENCQTLR
jgi:hypothetical protein